MGIIQTIFKPFRPNSDANQSAKQATLIDFPEIIENRLSNKACSITHISAFTYGNAGDTLLPIALHDTWCLLNNKLAWINKPVYPTVDSSLVHQINKTNGLIIGGGGLFLRDTNANKISGWQWPCSADMLHSIEVPVILFAVGYNRFRGQEEFEPFFKDNITAFAEKALYIGLRNSGSIAAIKNYLPENLHHKLRFQPCMTTILSELYTRQFDFDSKQDFVAFNAAFDRSHLRFGTQIGNILSGTARVLKEVSENIPIKFYSHMPSDEAIIPFLQSFGVKYELVRLNNLHPRKIIEEYAKPKLVVGMRGHAQMIPFGCKTPIVSIVSHNKMQWFLDDIQQAGWGADVNSATFELDLKKRIFDSLQNTRNEINVIAAKQKELLKISSANVKDGLIAMNLL